MGKSGVSAKWSRRIAAWKRSGLSAHEFAAREGVARSTLYWWSSQLKRQREAATHGDGAPEALRLVAVEVGADAVMETSTGAVKWELSTSHGHVLRAFGAVDAVCLGRLLAALLRADGCR